MTTLPLVLADTAEPMLRLLGRLHPAVVHFPIALVLTALAVEVWRVLSPWPREKVRRQPSTTALTCLGVGAAAGAVAAWFGWLSAAVEHPGPSQADLVDLHRWIGIVGAGLALVVLVLGLFGRGATAGAATTAYRLGLFLASTVIGVAGHLGASLVHGEAYITSAVSDVVLALRGLPPEGERHAPPRPAPGLEAGVVETTVPSPEHSIGALLERKVESILADRCVECHGPRKQKARLRLDDLADLAVHDVIVPGDPDASELVFRITLPADDPDIMPPEGEPLGAEEIAALREWIATLGSGSRAGASSSVPAEPVVPAAAPPPAPSAAPSADAERAMAALQARGAVVQRIAQSGAELEVDFSLLRADVTDADLALLAGLEPLLVALDLGDTAVTPGCTETLARFTRLEKLQLQRTAVDDGSMPVLAELPALHTLNIYGTGVGDVGLSALRDAAALRQVYAWGSAVTADGVAAFGEARPDVHIDLGDSLDAPAVPAEAVP